MFSNCLAHWPLSYTYFRENFQKNKYFREILLKSHACKIFPTNLPLFQMSLTFDFLKKLQKTYTFINFFKNFAKIFAKFFRNFCIFSQANFFKIKKRKFCSNPSLRVYKCSIDTSKYFASADKKKIHVKDTEHTVREKLYR
jgi:hypothetical protein